MAQIITGKEKPTVENMRIMISKNLDVCITQTIQGSKIVTTPEAVFSKMLNNQISIMQSLSFILNHGLRGGDKNGA